MATKSGLTGDASGYLDIMLGVNEGARPVVSRDDKGYYVEFPIIDGNSTSRSYLAQALSNCGVPTVNTNNYQQTLPYQKKGGLAGFWNNLWGTNESETFPAGTDRNRGYSCYRVPLSEAQIEALARAGHEIETHAYNPITPVIEQAVREVPSLSHTRSWISQGDREYQQDNFSLNYVDINQESAPALLTGIFQQAKRASQTLNDNGETGGTTLTCVAIGSDGYITAMNAGNSPAFIAIKRTNGDIKTIPLYEHQTEPHQFVKNNWRPDVEAGFQYAYRPFIEKAGNDPDALHALKVQYAENVFRQRGNATNSVVGESAQCSLHVDQLNLQPGDQAIVVVGSDGLSDPGGDNLGAWRTRVAQQVFDNAGHCNNIAQDVVDIAVREGGGHADNTTMVFSPIRVDAFGFIEKPKLITVADGMGGVTDAQDISYGEKHSAAAIAAVDQGVKSYLQQHQGQQNFKGTPIIKR